MSVDKGKGPVFDPGVCRCCGSLKRCRLLNAEYQCMGQKEVYSDMIMDCFGLLLSHLDDKPTARLVCATCVARLREAVAFRAQVLRCEAAFQQLRQSETDAAEHQARLDASAMLEVEIKPEPPDSPDPPGDPPSPPDQDVDPTELGVPEQSERVKCESPTDSDDVPLKRRKKRRAPTCPTPPPQPGLPEDQERKMSAEDEAELKKHRANLKIILEFSNATPIRCFSGIGYKCCHCTQIYRNPNDLKTHTLTHELRIRKMLMQRSHLSAFLVRMDITGLKCGICGSDMDSIEATIEHLKIAHDKKVYTDVKSHVVPFKFDDGLKCVVCSKVFVKFRNLQEHMNTHFRNYVCDACDVGYPNKRMLIQHYNMHKTGVFDCEFCPKTFNTEQKKKLHERFIHVYADKFLNKCAVCEARFKCYRAKEQHMMDAHGVSSVVKCQACERSFRNQRLLTIHLQRDHLMQRPHKCGACDMSFFEKQELRNHEVKHTGLREYTCEVCHKSYGRSKTLKEHARTHQARRFQCAVCGAGFVQRGSWRAHLRAKHAEQGV